MGLFDIFKKKPLPPKVEKAEGDVFAEADYKPIATVQVIKGIDAQYIYTVGNTFTMYEIGKYNTSHIHTYETIELASQGALDYLTHTNSQGFTNCLHIENSAHNAMLKSGLI